MNYAYLFFDADNTLLDFDRAEKEALETAWERAGYVYGDHVLQAYRKVNDQVWKEFEQGKITSEKLRIERFERLSHFGGFQDVDPEPMAAAYLEELSKNGSLMPGALTLVDTLSRSHTLGIITNGLKEVQEGRLCTSSLEKYMSFVVISDAIGHKKPDPVFFDYAVRAAGLPEKEACLVVGDSLRSDIAGGNSYGIHTCWFNPGGIPNRSSVQPTYTITDLEQLHSIV